MDRRDFFLGSAALAAAACTKTKAPSTTAPPATPLGANASWADIRAQFSLTRERIHMTGFLLASHPRPVADAIERHRRAFDEDPATYLEATMEPAERAVRTAAAKYVGGDFDDLAMTDSTTMGLGSVYSGLKLRPDDEILSTTHDHIVTELSLDYRAAKAGKPVRRVSLYDDPSKASTDEIVARFSKAITPQTKVIAVTWVHSGTGVKLPIRAMADVVAKANANRAEADRALFCVDGVHGFGNQDVRVAELGCDFFMAGCHKWIFGPRGTGLVWGKRTAWPATTPSIPSFDPGWRPESFDKIPLAAWMSPGGFHSFEHRWALNEAFAFHDQIGFTRVAARIRELNTRCKEQLAKVRNVRLITPMSPDLSAGIICFEIANKEPAPVVKALHEKGIVASVTPKFYPKLYARLAPSLLTDEHDVDRSVAAVAEVA